ncbi:hypothetical protein HNQ56_000050 [Anaerotaenia torta]|uniref:DUF6240 domain-containing protein n=1 Tax=Anaerotaenia torta TaxID=433293 RepID=UPI003D1A66CE
MNYTLRLGTERGEVSEKKSNSPLATDYNRGFLEKLTRGQRIDGTILAVDGRVTMDFGGQQLNFPLEMLPDAVPGEKRCFEVVKVPPPELELRQVERSRGEARRIIKAEVGITDKDWEEARARKEQEARQSGKDRAVRDSLGRLEDIGSIFTEQDCEQLERGGFPAGSMTVDGLYGAINRIKSGGAGMGSTLDRIENGWTEIEIAARLRAENLPVTAQNVQRINKALALGDTVGMMDEKTMKYLIAADAEPTVKNIYKAYYSGGTGGREQKRELTGPEWSQLESQARTIIENTGYEADKKNLSDARWLIENELPLTSRTFAYKKELEGIKEQADKNYLMDRMAEGMKSGAAPEDASLAVPDTARLQKVIEDVNSISSEAVSRAVREGQELTIKKLTEIQAERINSRKRNEEQETSPRQEYEEAELPGASLQEYEEVKAQRQLEEIRLRMTLEAAQRLEKKGISIETERLEKIVEELRRQEDSYYQSLLREAGAGSTPESVEILKNTTAGMERLRHIPSAVLGSTLADRRSQTIPGLLSEGVKLQAAFERAGTAYEPLMTVPSAEYGDSIQKAFANVNSLLSELGIENTRANQRAARILGYNQMEINQETIEQVKVYDKEVESLLQNLHPAVTVRMIKEGIDPMKLPIDQLNTMIGKMKEEQGITSEDKFSSYLHRLEKKDGITPEERREYIGVYRLLYQIEKSDGAALGAVVRADREVTLANLLTALQTRRKGSVNAAVDDGFGMLAEEAKTAEQVQYQERLLKQITEEITPQKLSRLQQEKQQNALLPDDQESDDRVRKAVQDPDIERKEAQEQRAETQNNQAQEIRTQNAQTLARDAQMQNALLQSILSQMPEGEADRFTSLPEEGGRLWGSIRDISLERLLEQLQDRNNDTAHQELYTNTVQQIRELSRNGEQALKFLNDYQMESTIQNIMLASRLLSNGLPPALRIVKQQEEEEGNSDQELKETQELSDTLIDKSSINEAFEKLEGQARTMLEKACSGEVIDSSRLAELKMLGQQTTFLRKLASREFYQIPVETAKGITNMNLTILRGSQESGRVSAILQSEALGDVKAEFSLKSRTVKGFITCNSREGLDRLRDNAAELMQAAAESGVDLKQLDFGFNDWDRDNYTYQNPEQGEPGVLPGNETERILYRMARALVKTVSLAENNGESR